MDTDSRYLPTRHGGHWKSARAGAVNRLRISNAATRSRIHYAW